MLNKLTPTHVTSDSGFEVYSGPMHVWVYNEGNMHIHITREAARLGNRWGEYVFFSEIPDHWLPPHNWVAIPSEKRDEIEENIKQALQALNVEFRAA